MAIKTEKELSANGTSLWQKAGHAVEVGNFAYAVQLIRAILKETPGFIEGRKLLRKAEVQATKGKRSFLSGLSSLSLKGATSIKKDPLAAMDLAEKTLETDPYSTPANHLLKEAALAAEMPEIATFALETLAEGNPRDTKVLHELAQHYYDRGDNDRAVALYNRIVELNPSDLIAAKKGKDASARSSMRASGWESAQDYRQLIKDKETAVALEQQGRVVKGTDLIDRQVCELYERAEKEPDNVDLARRIALLFEQKEDFESAVWWYDRAAALTGGADQTLVRKAFDLHLRVFDHGIGTRREFLAAAPEHEEAPRVQQELEQLLKQRGEMMIEEARRRVERNPTDLVLRFELGEHLLAGGHFTEAIPELQRARQNPNIRVKVLFHLGKCYLGKNMVDFAERQFVEAAKELGPMDNLKKEIVYQLGLLHERGGRAEKALECFKEIYEADYAYEDVARRVESSYAAGGHDG